MKEQLGKLSGFVEAPAGLHAPIGDVRAFARQGPVAELLPGANLVHGGNDAGRSLAIVVDLDGAAVRLANAHNPAVHAVEAGALPKRVCHTAEQALWRVVVAHRDPGPVITCRGAGNCADPAISGSKSEFASRQIMHCSRCRSGGRLAPGDLNAFPAWIAHGDQQAAVVKVVGPASCLREAAAIRRGLYLSGCQNTRAAVGQEEHHGVHANRLQLGQPWWFRHLPVPRGCGCTCCRVRSRAFPHGGAMYLQLHKLRLARANDSLRFRPRVLRPVRQGLRPQDLCGKSIPLFLQASGCRVQLGLRVCPLLGRGARGPGWIGVLGQETIHLLQGGQRKDEVGSGGQVRLLRGRAHGGQVGGKRISLRGDLRILLVQLGKQSGCPGGGSPDES